MTTDNSNKIKTKPATPDANTDAGGDIENGLDKQQDQDGNDSDKYSGSDSDGDTGNTDNINEGVGRYAEVSMHMNNDNQTESPRVVKGLYEFFLAEADSREHDSEATRPSPRPSRRGLRRVSAVSTRGRRKLPSSFFSTAKLRHLSGSRQIPQVSLPTSLKLNSHMTPPHIADNVSFGAGGVKALNGVNKAIYRKASPANLNYSRLLTYEMTVLEIATLWARSVDNGTNLVKKLGNLCATMQHQIMEHGKSTNTDKTASSWTHTKTMITKATPNLAIDILLLRLRHGVTRPPQGQHRGRLTTAIEHAHTHGHWGVMLSQVERYIQHFNLEMPADLAENADVLAIEDFKNTYRTATH